MNESKCPVEVTPRIARWRIENIEACFWHQSKPFEIGRWNWHLSVEKNKQIIIRLFPQASTFAKERPPIASFVIRVFYFTGRRRQILHLEVCRRKLRDSSDFMWAIDPGLSGKVIIDVEFFDLKAAGVGEPVSIWGSNRLPDAIVPTISALRQLLADGAFTDITINTSDGTTAAHRAILAARSPVFCSMFSHNLKEKELATVDVTDMSTASFNAFLQYLYGFIKIEEFIPHRMPLLHAADKYDVDDLREACEASLAEDVGRGNVFVRLQNAHLYRLQTLKSACMKYLVEFGRIYDLHDELITFLRNADRELVVLVVQEVLAAWKGD
ncbi:BTB/POZ domain-containing protein At1g55760-like [Wolffia australiana]